jgi:23S rRNA (cytosine1962-C5)-methyltransferase
MNTVFVKKGHEKLLRAGYVWAFARHFVDHGNLSLIERGQWVSVMGESGDFVGVGTFDPQADIMLRLFSCSQQAPEQLFIYRLKVALEKRDHTFEKPFYRWVYAEADGVPGCVVDRFGSYVSVALTTHGMWRLRHVLIEAIKKLIDVNGLIMRFDSRQARQESAHYDVIVVGDIPEYIPVWEDDRLYFTALKQAQKTGWYFDQRANHTYVANQISAGQSILDLFSYQGGFALGCALKGANVTLVDQSQGALDMAKYTLSHHGLSGHFVCQDVFDYMNQLQQVFDVVILDPPAMVTHKKHFHRGAGAYKKLIAQCMDAVSKNGMFVFASCSSHVKIQHMIEWVKVIAAEKNRGLNLMDQSAHDIDHPVPDFLPSMAYLKCCFWKLHD